MRYKIILLIFISICFSSKAYTMEMITGAFGMKFGQVYDSSKSIRKKQLLNGRMRYRFPPKKGFRSFSKYEVETTPLTSKVYKIRGYGKQENELSCKNEFDLIRTLLENKYGQITDTHSGGFANPYFSSAINQGNRSVVIVCKGTNFNPSYSIHIHYFNSKLAQLADKEQKVLDAKKKRLLIIEAEKTDHSAL